MKIIMTYALRYDCPKCGAKKSQPCGRACCVPRLHKASADPEIINLTVESMLEGHTSRGWVGS